MSWQEDPQSPLRVQISEYMLADGIAVRVTMRHSPANVLIGRISENGHLHFEPFDTNPLADPGITFSMQEEVARALLDALLRHYQGASDMHTVRRDLLHERGRVDRLIEVVSSIAVQASHPSTQETR